MTKVIVNLVLPVVAEAVDNVLQEYPEADCREAFLRPDLHQKLVSYVVNRVPGIYAVQEDAIAVCQDNQRLAEVVGRRREITLLIHQGIRWLCEENLVGSKFVEQQGDAQFMPSSWFG